MPTHSSRPASRPASPPARLITCEGGEGAGKTTQLAFLRDHMAQRGLSVLSTREPGGTPLGEAVRNLLLDPAHVISGKAETLLLFAARAEHIARVIQPALTAGQWVLCDRFTDATYAYQGAGRGLPVAGIALLEQWVQEDLRPDLTIILDIPPTLGLARLVQRGHAPDRFEQESLAFFERVRQGYLSRARHAPARYLCIDAARPVDVVQADMIAQFSRWYEHHVFA